jgi:hypothetical protein
MALPAAIISFLLLLLAPACLILDLHQPTRFWHTLVPEYFNNTSALSYGSWLLTAYPIANLIYIYFIFVKNDRVTRILGMVTVPLAIFVHAYTGFAFALVRARAWWHSALMPVFSYICSPFRNCAPCSSGPYDGQIPAGKVGTGIVHESSPYDDRNPASGPFLEWELLADTSGVQRGWARVHPVGLA